MHGLLNFLIRHLWVPPVAALVSALLLMFLVSCGGGGENSGGGGNHTLAVTITGLDTNLGAKVTVTGPGTYNQDLNATRTLTGLADGTYTITAATVIDTSQPGLGLGNGGKLGSEHLQRYPLKPVQTVTVNGGAATATVDYPAATLTVQIPKAGLTGTEPMDFVLVPAGSFTMGSDANEDNYGLNAKPPHTVTIGQAFYVAKTELTQAQWKAAMGAADTHTNTFPGDTLPVEGVSWNTIKTSFLPAFNVNLPGYGFRLPSEAEWEYTCRAGTTTAYFFGDDFYGDDFTKYCTYANWNNSHTVSVASLAPNPWGLYDIEGNVSEWCEDDGHQGGYGTTGTGIPTCPDDGNAWVDNPRGSDRALRGGSWFADEANIGDCRSAVRSNITPNMALFNVGFRVVLPVPGTH